MASFFPPSMRRPEAKDELLAWVKDLPLDPLDKKNLLLDWSALTGVHLTPEEIRAAAPGLLQDEYPPAAES